MTLIASRLDFSNLDTIERKFCADGTKISRETTVLNVCFSCLNEPNKCESEFGHFTLGILEIDVENNGRVAVCLKEIADQTKQPKEICINNKVFKLKKLLVCDLKMQAICMGINCANSDNPCPFC